MPFRYNAITGELDIVDTSTATGYIKQIDTDAGSVLPVADIINLLGTAAQGISSSGAGNTVTLTIADATEIQKGVVELATDAEAIGGADTSRAIVSTSLKAKLGTQTANSIAYGTGDTLAFGWTNALTDGMIVIGATAGTPEAANITSIGGTVTITNGANTINLEAGAAVPTSFVTDAGTATPALNILNVLGGNNISTVGAGNTVTLNLTGTTDHAIQIGNATGSLTSVGPGSTGELLVSTTGGDPSWATVSYGDFSFNNVTSVATPRMVSIANTDVNAASHADLRLSTPPLGGDSLVSWEVQGSHFFAAGVDNQVAGDPWKLSNSSHPSGGTAAITVDATTAAVTFASAYEFPVADGNANDVMSTDGAGNIDFVAAGSLLTDLDNILYVGKHGADANNGKTANNAKLTIQAAVTAAAAGDTIIVFPGTYTETITHAANNVTLIAEGKPSNCIITQADANVIDFNTRSGILYKNFGIHCTAATTAINTIEGTTGTCVIRDCQTSMISAAAIAAIAQPAIGAVTGAGELSIRFGIHTYTHTGNGGATANKAAFRVGTGGSVHLDYIHTLTISNSGTALVSATGIDTNSTGVFEIHDCYIEVTDPNAVIVCGLVSLGGTGITNEFFRNEVHVTATNNNGYGFWSADTASSSRFFYNHIHVTDVAGSSYSFLIGNGATVISQFDDIVAADGYSLTAGGNFCQVDSEIDGDLTCACSKAADTQQITIANRDNTATASNAALNLSVGGTTSTGDPYVNFLITGGTTFSLGQDNSDATYKLKLTDGATPSAGNIIWQTSGYQGTGYTYQTSSRFNSTSSGGIVDIDCSNLSLDADSDSAIIARIQSTGLGDPYFAAIVNDAIAWKFGCANALADAFVLGTGGTGVSALAVTSLSISLAGEVTMPLQPAFLAYRNANLANQTGAAALVTVPSDTEVYDQNADYNTGTYTFTSPITGRYTFNANVYMYTIPASTLGFTSLVTSNRTYYLTTNNPNNCKSVGDELLYPGSLDVDMDAADTAYVNVYMANGAGNTAGIAGLGGAVLRTAWSGRLVC